MNYNNLSKKSKLILSSYYKNYKVINVKEKIYHDGYDEDGPESDLYDLYVRYYERNQLKEDYWHAEEWFTLNCNSNYELLDTKNINS